MNIPSKVNDDLKGERFYVKFEGMKSEPGGNGSFSGKIGDHILVHETSSVGQANKRLLVVGVGEEKNINTEVMMKATSSMVKALVCVFLLIPIQQLFCRLI